MKIGNLTLAVLCTAAAVSCGGSGDVDYTQFVNTKIGSGGHGHVFVGASVPFGLVQVGPTSIPQTWDWCSGYHDSDSTVIGFSHTHLSGTGVGDLFDITVMPVVGDVTYARGEEEDPQSGLWSYADRTREVTRPEYYSVPLTRYGITAEMTATERVGLHRYTFPASDEAAVVFDLENGGCWDRPTSTHIYALDDHTLAGWRYSIGWAEDQRVYFVAELSKPFDSFETVKAPEGTLKVLTPHNVPAPEVGGERYGRASFSVSEGERVLLKVALSPVGIEGAQANLAAELPGWDFEGTMQDARAKWNSELSKVRVETADKTARTVFYTALYHTMIEPALFCDCNGDYRGADGKIHQNPGHSTYTTYSLWDTYRAQMPMMTILFPERIPDIVNNMLAICDEQGRLPVWHLWGCETDCMVGNPGVSVVADAMVKGFEGFDYERAYEAIRSTSMNPGRGNGLRIKYGYIPCDLYNQAVANDMEYDIADAAAARAAALLGKADDEAYFTERSHSYRHYFDSSIGFIRGRDSKGRWRASYNPFYSNHLEDDFCEGNGWQYTWLVPQDVWGLEECFGSRERMLGKLDSLFTVSSVVEGEYAAADISGLIGQYAHGNEPSHHVLYLYTMLGEPWKTAEKVREVLGTLYFNDPDGLSGNEDAGQMSAWYILSAMGLYEVEPAGARYWFGSPLFDRVSFDVSGGTFTIVAENNSSDNIYIRSVELNGAAYNKPWIDYADIVKGGELRFKMGSEPALWYDPDVE